MLVKGITKRWLINNLGVTVVFLIILIFGLSFAVRSFYYDGIKRAITERGDEVITSLSGLSAENTENIDSLLREYTENFADKELMELMIIDDSGNVIFNSTGFETDKTQEMPDYEQAKTLNEGAYWTGNLNSGEKVMAYTRVVNDSSGGYIVACRFVVSLSIADSRILTAIIMLIVVAAVVLLFFVISGMCFINSIVRPVRELSTIAGRIAQGDFETRARKRNDDEIGELADSINNMAEEIKATDRMKNDFISSVSHELRTPLTAIKGWAETMSVGGEPDPSMINKGLGVIVNETERLTGIVEELLDFSRIQNGRMVLVTEKIDLLAELDEAIYMLRERAVSEKKHLIYDEPDHVSPVLGDKNRLRQVFINVIDNALKYTPEDGVIGIQVVEEDEMLKVIISDTGCGIAKEDLPRIREKFYKANQTVRGSGIGLAVADEIMTLHKGALDIESVEGVGTTVTISIPLLDRDDVELLSI